MTILVAILRLAHIVLGMIWVGFGALTAWILHPAADQLGEKGLAMLRSFYGYSRFTMVMPIAAIGTTLAGLILWPLRTSSNLLDLLAFSTTGDVVMVIGAVVGLLAFGHGAGATGRFSGVFAEAARRYDQNPTPAHEQALQEAKGKLTLHSNISAWLALVAVVCMAGARYIG
ncbi:MAG: hypothetical protein GYB64_05340 [Chloroflexi bacterium]|nr:hypothetical protein [Chloroflexota bacterium]